MTKFIALIRNGFMAGLLLLVLPAAAQAAAYIKYEGIDGEATSGPVFIELTANMRAADILFEIARRSGMDQRRIQLILHGNRLTGQELLSQVRRTPLSCQLRAQAPRRMNQKQREQVSFCYQKIVWTVRAEGGGIFRLSETEEDMPRRSRRVGG